MTRLKEADVRPIVPNLAAYDAHLKRMTGATLRQIACKAAGVREELIVGALDQIRIAAVPISSGLGVISGFSSTVATIVHHLGFEAGVTRSCDVAGIVEGSEGGAQILMLADDHRFVAITPGQEGVVDNTPATALGFVAGLELMKGGLSGESVLMLGCGPLGVAAAKALLERGAKVALCDTEKGRAAAALGELGGKLGSGASDRIWTDATPLTALQRYEVLFDATNEGSFIEAAHLTPHSMVAAPGVPCGLTPEAVDAHRDRILHDALEIGTATMVVQAAAKLVTGTGNGRAGGK
jgi:pyrrolysine biosynthesis protein PylD